MQIERIEISKLVGDPANVRKHGERNVASIVASLHRFGQQKPIVIDSANIVRAGNGTMEAARSMGWTHLNCVRTELQSSDAIAYAIADNRTAELAEWDDDALAAQLNGLLADDPGLLDVAGFSEDEMAALLGDIDGEGTTGKAAEDEVPEPPTVPITNPGDLWLLGEHRVLCGDSTKAKDVELLMGGATADLCFTSPPYGQQRDYTAESKEKCSDWDGLMRGVFANLPMSNAGQVLVNLGLIHREGEWVPYWDGWIEWMREQGWRRFGWYVWDQGFGLPGDWNGRFGPSHEFVFHFNKKGVKPMKWVDKQPENVKPRNAMESTMRGKDGKTVAFTNPGASEQPTKVPDSVVRIGRQVGSNGHPAQFSVGFASAFLLSWPGVAYEPFCGSGTTLVAAEQLGRKCYGMEISPQYCDVIVKRWENLTGKTAVCQSATQD